MHPFKPVILSSEIPGFPYQQLCISRDCEYRVVQLEEISFKFYELCI